MMTRYVSLAGLALAAASGIGATAIHAQAPPRLNAPAYYIAEFELTDPGGIRPYSAGVAATFEPFGGRFIVRGGEIAALEGERPKGRLVVIAFDSMEKAGAGMVQLSGVPAIEINPPEVGQLADIHR